MSPIVTASLAIAAAAVWIGSLMIIFKSSKFRRPWLWVLLTLLFAPGWGWSGALSNGWHWSAGIGFPIGSIYVIGFWLLGPRPVERFIEAESE
jgi:hypothetical protein